MRGPGDTVGPYRLEQKIGEGSYGVVFLAVAVRQGGVPIPVALKVARDRAVGAQAFLGEASTWVRAGGHPNVVPVIDAGVYDDEFLLVSEYIEGGTLRDRIVRENGKGQPVDEALRILDGILLGLEHLHGRGVIHRDLKPQNILMQGGIPRLSDFGVARLAGGATSQTTNRAGTLVYMPPEAFSGTVSRQTDLWAAGIMLFEMLTGRVSFLGATEFAIMGAICNSPLPTLPEWVPAEVSALVAQAVARDRNVRFKTADEFRRAAAHVMRTAIGPVDGEHREAALSLTPHQARVGGVFLVNTGSRAEQIQIPPDTQDGFTLHLRGRGQSGKHGGRPGDLHVQIKVLTPRATRVGDSLENPRDGATLVWVPPGQFRMGDNASPFQLDKPEHQVGLSTGVWLYKYPVTNTQYLRFLEANPEHPRPLFWDESKFNHPEQPVCGVSWHDAQEYCRWAGVRLPTEAEWEYAARGPEGRRYPWGDAAPTMDLAVYYQEGRTNRSGRVGRRPAGASWCGAEQMAGNVWEWCEDTYQPYVAGETVDPLPATGEGPRVVRGGAWNFPPLSTLSSNRHANGPNARANNIGFRPAVNPGVLDPSDS